MKALRQLGTELRHKNPYWEYRLDRYALSDGKEAEYWYAHTHGSVFVIARTDDARFVMTAQMRYLNRRESLEFPGGGIPQDVEPEVQARRELREETGYEADTWTKLGAFNPMNGLTDEICHVFLAEGLHAGAAHPDPTEDIEVRLLGAEEIDEACAVNGIWDGMTLAAWMLYRANPGRDKRWRTT
ncbi:MAG: NUDIX domain-containing protein [Candidatus Kapaibacterium sp.]